MDYYQAREVVMDIRAKLSIDEAVELLEREVEAWQDAAYDNGFEIGYDLGYEDRTDELE